MLHQFLLKHQLKWIVELNKTSAEKIKHITQQATYLLSFWTYSICMSLKVLNSPNKDSSPRSCWPLTITSPKVPSGWGYLVWVVWPLAFATADCIDNFALASEYQKMKKFMNFRSHQLWKFFNIVANFTWIRLQVFFGFSKQVDNNSWCCIRFLKEKSNKQILTIKIFQNAQEDLQLLQLISCVKSLQLQFVFLTPAYSGIFRVLMHGLTLTFYNTFHFGK